VKTLLPPLDYVEYDAIWQRVAQAGVRDVNLDVWAAGRRYLSLATLSLSPAEADELRLVTNGFARLLDLAVERILEDREWWPTLAWPWPAIELARQEHPHPTGLVSLFGRFDCLLDATGHWQVIEYNSDTPSGGREVSGLEPALAHFSPELRRLSRGFRRRLATTIARRIAQHARPVRVIGIVSSHSWLEDMSQATWLAYLLGRAGQPALVGDVTDLAARDDCITLRGRPIDALYRFYPLERLYRHAIFAPLVEASLDGRLLLLNGLRGFLAQSKACLAWLWMNRRTFDRPSRLMIERHLPPTVLARDPQAAKLLPRSVVKHVNGREGDSVVFGSSLDAAGWDARLLEPGYVVQRAVDSQSVQDVVVDEWHQRIECVSPRYACVGAFAIGARFAGVYTRLDGPITSARATYVATLAEASAAAHPR
jgi:glutathionylspermidine synthase